MATLPNLGNTTPLGPQVTYPYGEAYPQEGQVKVTLYSLPWNETNLPTFTSKTALNAFLDDLDDTKIVELSQFTNKAPEFTTPLEVPYDSALNYTYMRVRTVQVAPNVPVPFEKPDGKRDYYYFITAATYANPSNTYFDIQLDIWHTFFDEIEIGGADLKRGHLVNELAPSVDEYLSNPLAHTSFLTAPDYNLGDPADLYASTIIEQFGGTAERYLVLFVNVSRETLQLFREVGEHTPTPPTFNGGTIASPGLWTYTNYEEVTPLPYAPNTRGTSTPNGIFAYAVKMSDAADIVAKLDAHGQHLLQRITAAAVLPDSLIRLGAKISTDFGDFYPLELPDAPLSRLVSRELDAAAWNMPDVVKYFAKAYTYPYAHIVVTMPDGTTRPIQIETLGEDGMSYRERLTAAFPWLSAEVFLEGYKANGAEALTWRTLDNQTALTDVPSGAWNDTLARFQIPTFTLWRTSYAAWRADNQASILSAKESTVNAYNDTKRGADTANTNAHAAAEAAYTSSVNSANTAYNNTVTSANTAYANTDAAAGTSVTNQTVSNNNAGNNTVRNISYMDAKVNAETTNNSVNYQLLKEKAMEDNWIAGYQTRESVGIEIENMQAMNSLNGITGVVSGAASGATTGAVAGLPGIVGGAVVGAAAGAVQWGVSTLQTNIAISKQTALAQLTQLCNYGYYDNNYENAYGFHHGAAYNLRAKNNANNLSNTLKEFATDFNIAVNNNNVTAASTIANNNAATSRANAARSRDAAIATANAARNTSNANADRTRNTSNANADRTLETTLTNAQADVRAAYENVQHAYKAAEIGANMPQTQATGDASLDVLAERNVTISHVTQTKDALEQLGQLWRRYGYSYNGRLPRPLTPATSGTTTSAPCTFWQLEDLTFTKPLMRMWQDRLTALLSGGVTFWKKPLFDPLGV